MPLDQDIAQMSSLFSNCLNGNTFFHGAGHCIKEKREEGKDFEIIQNVPSPASNIIAMNRRSFLAYPPST